MQPPLHAGERSRGGIELFLGETLRGHNLLFTWPARQ
jgi:hypothetical protein